MHTELLSSPLERLKNNEISFTEFLKKINCYDQYSRWCKDHFLKEDEGAAQCFFDYFGFEDENVIKIYIESVA